MTTWSIQVFCFSAAMMPKGMPMASVRMKEKRVSVSVVGRRSAIAVETLRPSRIDWPRSPWVSPQSHLPSCCRKGWSRPSWVRTRSISTAVACGPAMTTAGSPGTSCMMQNEISVTINSTGKALSTRWMI